MDLQNRAEAGSDGHDESVLNPEMPNETDLTKKERRRIEKEKLKGMGTGKKIQYIWMYYKPVMFGILAAIVLAFVLKDWYINAKTKRYCQLQLLIPS